MPRKYICGSVSDRFWAHVEKSDGCWTWDAPESDGYGKMKIDGRKYYVHRVSWELNCGVIPEGLSVLHKCDNPPCVRPDHLFLGTQKDNMADAASKGRCNGPAKSQPGEDNPAAKLSWGIVDQIRASTLSAAEWGIAVGVHRVTIHAIRSGKRWPLENHP
jgi:hypothetical protein